MNVVTKIFVCSLLVVFAAVGCDFNPSAPFAGFDGEASQGGMVSDQGATLNGTFMENGGSASSLGAYASTAVAGDLTVIVLDSEPERNEIGRVEVVNGRFTLRGLPNSFILEFWDGDTKVGEETFEGVKPNQEIDIVLEIDEESGQVVLLEESRTGIDHEAGQGIEIDGAASNIVVDDPHLDWTGSLDVNEYHVFTKAAQTSIRKGNRSLTLAELKERDQVHVRGVFVEVDGKMQIFAHEIKLQEEVEEDELEDKKVTICHIPPGNPDNAKTKEVSKDAVAAHLAHGDTLGLCP